MKQSSLLLVLLFSSSMAYAQGSTCISAGLAIPKQPSAFSTYWKTGFSMSVGVDIPFADWLALSAAFDFNSFLLNEERFLEGQGIAGTGLSVSGGSSSVFTLLAGAKVRVVHAPKLFSAYVTGQVGYLNFSTGDIVISADSSAGTLVGGERSSFCTSAGGGVEVPLNQVTDVFIEGRYVVDFKEKRTAFIPIRLGLRIRL